MGNLRANVLTANHHTRVIGHARASTSALDQSGHRAIIGFWAFLGSTWYWHFACQWCTSHIDKTLTFSSIKLAVHCIRALQRFRPIRLFFHTYPIGAPRELFRVWVLWFIKDASQRHTIQTLISKCGSSSGGGWSKSHADYGLLMALCK